MARNQQDNGIEHPDEPDLAPFMNLVIILIPMLLLSVVFIEVAVINVTMPLGGSSTTDEDAEEEEESLDLSITLSTDGLYVSAAGEQVEPIDGCPTQGPTVCTDDGVDVEAAFDEARQDIMAGSETTGEERLNDALEAYQWRELYNMLIGFKEDFPDETTVRLTADSDIPFALTVRTMDVARYRLEEDSYDNDEDFWQADYQTETAEDGDEQYTVLFGDPAFAVHE